MEKEIINIDSFGVTEDIVDNKKEEFEKRFIIETEQIALS